MHVCRYVHENVGASRGHWFPWSWNYRQLWESWHGAEIGTQIFLQEQQVHIAVEPFLWPISFHVFNGRPIKKPRSTGEATMGTYRYRQYFLLVIFTFSYYNECNIHLCFFLPFFSLWDKVPLCIPAQVALKLVIPQS